MLQLRDRGFKYSLRRWLRISGLWIRRLAELDPRFPVPVPGIISLSLSLDRGRPLGRRTSHEEARDEIQPGSQFRAYSLGASTRCMTGAWMIAGTTGTRNFARFGGSGRGRPHGRAMRSSLRPPVASAGQGLESTAVPTITAGCNALERRWRSFRRLAAY